MGLETGVVQWLNNATLPCENGKKCRFQLLFFLDALSTAAGKSTFVEILKQADEEWEVVPEPVARWCNVQHNSEEDCEVWHKKLRFLSKTKK